MTKFDERVRLVRDRLTKIATAVPAADLPSWSQRIASLIVETISEDELLDGASLRAADIVVASAPITIKEAASAALKEINKPVEHDGSAQGKQGKSRRNDPSTAKAAAKNVDAENGRGLALIELGRNGEMSSQEIADALDRPRDSFSNRVSELVSMGYAENIRDAGGRLVERDGKKLVRITPLGRSILRGIQQ